VGGTTFTSGTITLAGATSPSNAATLILAGFTSPTFSVTYDAVTGAFTFTSTATGATATITAATGSLATSLKLTSGAGAIISQGAAALTPATAIPALVAVTQNWATFTTMVEPSLTDKVAFAAATNALNNRYMYAMWDTDPNAVITGNQTTAGYVIGTQNQYSGTAPIYVGRDKAVFLMGAVASLDVTQRNGRATMAYRRQSGLIPDVNDATTAANLEANGYNYYGAVATANANFNFNYPGSVTMMTLLTEQLSIPYNVEGYALVQAAGHDPINAAVNFGTIRAGVVLSDLEAQQVNQAAGVKIDNVLNQRGWYLQVLDAQPSVRVARQSPPITLWYMDGQSVQRINVASVLVQ
jgi:hypothetical protein